MRKFVQAECNTVQQALTEYLDEALPPGERERFEQHLAGCASCAHHLHRLRQTLQRLASLPREPMPTPLKEHLLRSHSNRRSA